MVAVKFMAEAGQKRLQLLYTWGNGNPRICLGQVRRNPCPLFYQPHQGGLPPLKADIGYLAIYVFRQKFVFSQAVKTMCLRALIIF